MTKIPPKNTKLPPLFFPQKIQKSPQKIQKWPHRFSPQKIQKSPQKIRFVNYVFFCIFGIIFVFLGGFLYYLGKFCFIWGIIVLFAILFIFFGGYFRIFWGEKRWGHFCIFWIFFCISWGDFCFFWGKKSGRIFVFLGGFLYIVGSFLI
jgi:hypothetical protein